jgi:hypothetical protein
MGLFELLRPLVQGGQKASSVSASTVGPDLDAAELARRPGVGLEKLRRIEPAYHEFTIPKRGGGTRRILAPSPPLKAIPRRILRRLLGRLNCHRAVRGFEPGESIVTNALPHVGKAVVVRLDLKDFFASTSAQRVHDYFR